MSQTSARDRVSAGVIDAVRSLQRSLNNAKLYSIDHPRSRQPLEAFVKKMNAVCRNVDTVTVIASFEGLSWGETKITQENEENKGLGNLLLREGIEKLSFKAGLTFDEVYYLMTLLRMNFTEEQEETLESLLWQAEMKNIQFQAINALGESETISAMAGNVEDIEAMEKTVEGFIEHKPNAAAKNFKEMAGPPDFDHEDEGLDTDYEGTGDEEFDISSRVNNKTTAEERFWNEYFTATKEEDALDIDIMCEEITEESVVPLMLRALGLLMATGLESFESFPERDLMKLSSGITEQLFSMGDLEVVRKVLIQEHALRLRVGAEDVDRNQFLDKFGENVIPPARIAGMLVQLDYSDAKKAFIGNELIARMPDKGISTLMEWGASFEFKRLLPFYQTLYRAAGKRAIKMVLVGNMRTAGDRILISFIRLIRVAGVKNARFDQVRDELSRHPSFTVRQAALAWYADVELGAEDVQRLVAALTDTNVDIQHAALDALRSSRPAIVRGTIEKTITERFDRLSLDQKTTLLTAYGVVAENTALPVLKKLLLARLPLFDEDRHINATIEAAAKALLAVDTPEAMKILEGQARGLIPNTRKKICRRILSEGGEEE